ncbi:MAG: glycosyltransferase [Euzebyales bacterium]|jgi:glycosyltransferase involved in cell wall biosynthesis|nr:glycosyltransferase [Euzebyales bacterium]
MRIVHYHPRAVVGDGGITNSVQRLSTALAALGADPVIVHDVSAGSRQRPGANAEPPGSNAGVQWIGARHLGPSRMLLPVGLERALEGADLLVLNSAWTTHNARAGAVARKLGVPYALAPRGAYEPALLRRKRVVKRLWWEAVEQPLVRHARALHIFFEGERPSLARLGYHGDVIVAPNGVSVPSGFRWDGGSGGYLLYMGRFDPEHKGIDLLVRAVAELPAGQRPALRLHGPDWRGGKRRVRDLVRTLGVESWVTLGDAVYGEQKWATLSRARGFVYPSRWEGFGNSLAEASALGVPALATPYPLARFLGELGAAIVVEPTSSGVAAGLRELSNPEAAAVGERAAQVIQDQFTWEAVARRWLEQARALSVDQEGGS